MTTLNKPTGNYVSAADIVNQAYGSIGRSGIGSAANQIDQEGYDYWLNQLQSGAMFPDQFQRAFLNAAANYSGPNASAYQPSINAAKDLLKPPLPAGMYYDQNGNLVGGLPNAPQVGYGVGSENMQTNGLLGLVNIPNVPLQSSPDNSNGIYATERDPSSPTRRDPWDYPTQLEPTGWYEPGGGGNPLGITPLSNVPTTGYSRAVSTGPNYADIVNQAYGSIGRSGIGTGANQIDQEGYDYWLNQLASGAISPDQFKSVFNNAAEDVYINQAYQDLFGRAADEAGLNYYRGALDTTNKEDIYNAIRSGARGSDIASAYGVTDADISGDITAGDIYNYVNQNINDPYAIFSAAEKYNVDPATITKVLGWSPEDSAGFLKKYELAKKVQQEYKDIGRGLTGDEAIDKEGFNYWYNQLQSGNITPEQFEKTFLTSALDVVGKGGVGSSTAARTVVEALDKGYDVGSAIDKANPLDVYELLRDKGLSAEKIVENNPNIKLENVTDYLSKIPGLYEENVDKTITDVLGANAVSAFTPEQKQTLVNNLLSGDATRDDLAKSFQESGANKQQEAARIANVYAQAFGGSEEDAKALFAKLAGLEYKGTGVVSDTVYNEAKKAFDTALKSEKDANAGITSLITKAAKQEGAENRKFFQDNPEAFLMYDDLEVRSDDPWAKYGEIHNAPIYDANAVDKYMEKIAGDGNLNSASNFAHRDTRRLGVDTGGIIDGGSAFIKRGADVLGLTKEKEYISGNEGEQIDTGKYVISGDINKAAQQAGIDPSKYQDKYKTETRTDPETGQEYKVQVLDKSANEQIYDAINEKYKDLYIIGNVNPDNDNDKSQNNFMYTPYKRTEDGKLIAIAEPTLYTGAINPDVYKKKGIFGGGFLGDFAQGIASIPLVAEIAAATIPGAAAYYPALKAAQTAAFTTDLGDIAKTGGIAALGQYGAQYVSPYVSKTLGTGPLATNLATGATLGAAGAGIMGQDIGKGALTGLTGAGLAYGTNQLLPEQGMKIASDLGIDPKYQSLFANTLARLGPTILTGGKIDPTKLLMSYAMNKAMKEGKEKMRTA